MRLVRLLRHGKGLRHLPIVLPDRDDPGVRVTLHGLANRDIDVSRDHVPVSLRPLVIGVRIDDDVDDRPANDGSLRLEFHDAIASAHPLASIKLRRAGSVRLSSGSLRLFEATGCRNSCVTMPTRWWRYALAWQHARNAHERGDGLCMSASDLRCLNVYYMAARPVYLIGVSHEGRSNVFPMDLVGALSSGDFLLALRATSPAIKLMEGSGRIAMSGAPSDNLKAVYDLGAHHRAEAINLSDLPFTMRTSELFGLPVLAENGLVRELAVREIHRIGSHVLFVTHAERENGHTDRQLAHVSGMYGEWLASHGRALTPA
jgi:flavin reductase (DIM6/NTAB) family NADH-FMN oxidoreductase RutF